MFYFFSFEFFVVVHFSVSFFFLFFPFSQVKNTWENFRLDFLRKKGKRGAWFIINLMQNVYKFILFFSKTLLFFMMMLLVRICGRCHLHLRMDVFMFWISGLIWRPLKIKSLTTIFKLSGYFSAECTRSREEHSKNTGNKLERSPVPFHNGSQMHRCYSKCEFFSLERHCF